MIQILFILIYSLYRVLYTNKKNKLHNTIFIIFIINKMNTINLRMKITTKPSSKKYKYNIPLFWKIANKNEIDSRKPTRFIFNNYPIAIYKDATTDTVKAISDICIHRGASLSQGNVYNGCVQCPYHGWEYKDGLVEKIPGIPNTKSQSFGVPRFEIQEINDDIYLRPSYDINSQKGNIYNHTIYIPPEATDSNFVRITGRRHIHRPSSLITENVLDMMHISYVHSFGNTISPVPFKIDYDDIGPLSGRTTFYYTAGPTSMSALIGGAKFVEVQNEFHLPDATVTRVNANELVKTIITHCYPIGNNESILHFDLYRNFLTSPIFDSLFQYQMQITLDEDVGIINYIYDEYILGFMSNKFDITQVKYREKMKRIINDDNDDKK